MSAILSLVVALITAAGALLIALSAVAATARLLQSGGTDAGLDAMRTQLASGLIATLGLMGAATLLKTLTLESWSALGLFALVFALRLLIKRSLAQASGSAEPR